MEEECDLESDLLLLLHWDDFISQILQLALRVNFSKLVVYCSALNVLIVFENSTSMVGQQYQDFS